MFLSKAVRAATLAVAGAFLLSSLPAAAAPALSPPKAAVHQPAGIVEIAAKTDADKAKKKPAKKASAKKKPDAKKKPAKSAKSTKPAKTTAKPSKTA